MLKQTLLFLLIVFSVAGTKVHALPNEIEYTISAQLDATRNIIVGTETVRFTNRTGTVLQELYFHVIPNAFKRGANTKYQQDLQQAGLPADVIYDDPNDDAFLQIKRLEADGQELPYALDDTLMRVVLKDPLANSQVIQLRIEFVNDLMQPSPRALWAANLAIRSGHRNGTYTITLWYPKIVVYDVREGWNLDKYGLIGEFYGDFADYRVELRVPSNFTVGGTGAIVSEIAQGDHKTVTFTAHKTRDFAWVASSSYQAKEIQLSDGAQLRVLSLSFSAMDTTAADALDFYSERFGSYAYPVATVAQVSVGGGMEYPGIVMIAGGSVLEIVHELAHQWWYAAVGNDEMDEAWLDESFATFSEELYEIERRQFLPASVRSSHNFREPGTAILTRAERFPSLGVYFETVYKKGSGVLWMLRFAMGHQSFDHFIREYYARLKFKNATVHDVIQIAEEASGQELDSFFAIWLHTTRTLDFSIPLGSSRSLEDGQIEMRLTLVRRGEAIAPVRVVLTLRDGSRLETRWDGQGSTLEIAFRSRSAPAQAEVDPDHDVLEENRTNNILVFPTQLDTLSGKPFSTYDDHFLEGVCARNKPSS